MVLVEVAPLAELRVKLVQTLHLDGQVLKTLELRKALEAVVVLAELEFLEAEVAQALQHLDVQLLAVVVVGENLVAITARPMQCLVEMVD